MTRRSFLGTAGAAGSLLVLPGRVPGQDGEGGANAKLNIACVGVGGMGGGDVRGVSSENIVALCDVDDRRAAGSYRAFPNARRFKDYRRMLDEMGDGIDAVTVSTPDHAHFPIALAAIERGKHVYVQKPMAQTVKQCRILREAARTHGVVSQMGNQGHSSAATRNVVEWVRGGVIGPVREVKCWTNRPVWPQGMKRLPVPEPVPAHLAWDLWLAGRCDYDFSPAYMPFKWRGWCAFGCGALGDMACHIMDAAFWALQLREPTAITAETSESSVVAFPRSSVVTYEFPARDEMPPLTLTWYDGTNRPERPEELEEGRKMGNSMGGSLIIGEKGTIMTDSHCGSARIIPEAKMTELKSSLPPRTLPRIKGGHYRNWINACKGRDEACSNFEYAAPFTEMVLLGCIAQRLPGQRLEWRAEEGFVDNDGANHLVGDPLPSLTPAVLPRLGLSLPATLARIHGDAPEARCDGGKIQYWHKVSTWVSWDIEVPRAGRAPLSVFLANEGHAGSEFEVLVGDRSFPGVVPDTKGWQTYHELELGTVDFAEAGTCTIALKPKTKPGRAVMNLDRLFLDGDWIRGAKVGKAAQ